MKDKVTRRINGGELKYVRDANVLERTEENHTIL